ncbi:MAG: thioredoxin [Propionibacteriaceae bacterium]|jgi:thioredoxin 1|nr:thioredoxin [Propionibacteriaceae bacterium]
MALRTVTQSDFADVVSADGITLVDFWAAWCGPCRAFGPIFERAAENHPTITFAKVNTDEEQELAGSLGISSIPTIMAFRDGIAVYFQPGALNSSQLEELIGKVEELDMEKVRAQAQTVSSAV